MIEVIGIDEPTGAFYNYIGFDKKLKKAVIRMAKKFKKVDDSEVEDAVKDKAWYEYVNSVVEAVEKSLANIQHKYAAFAWALLSQKDLIEWEEIGRAIIDNFLSCRRCHI